MAKLREQSIRAHHLKVIDQVNDALKSSFLNCHSYLVRWSPDHAIKANCPQISRLLLLNINFLFHSLKTICAVMLRKNCGKFWGPQIGAISIPRHWNLCLCLAIAHPIYLN